MPQQASPPTSAPVSSVEATVLALTGEIDAASAGATRLRTLAAIDDRPAALVLDLSGVEFFGSNGIAIVLETAQRAEIRRIPFVVVAGQHRVLRPLQVTGVADRLTIRPTVADARAALRDPRIPAARSGGV
ncbi:STAS domain-containing protein [Umezawaea sp. NPDC059074]|uniref:STAS domain-containing protein n=1 Tax=Umezawaea sp. NPDC059074 TaxID=3346716 RepID=UPI00368F8595